MRLSVPTLGMYVVGMCDTVKSQVSGDMYVCMYVCMYSHHI